MPRKYSSSVGANHAREAAHAEELSPAIAGSVGKGRCYVRDVKLNAVVNFSLSMSVRDRGSFQIETLSTFRA